MHCFILTTITTRVTVFQLHQRRDSVVYVRRLGGVWRTAYGIGMIPILYMLYYRIFRLRESAVWKKRKTGESRNMGLLFKHYW